HQVSHGGCSGVESRHATARAQRRWSCSLQTKPIPNACPCQVERARIRRDRLPAVSGRSARTQRESRRLARFPADSLPASESVPASPCEAPVRAADRARAQLETASSNLNVLPDLSRCHAVILQNCKGLHPNINTS